MPELSLALIGYPSGQAPSTGATHVASAETRRAPATVVARVAVAATGRLRCRSASSGWPLWGGRRRPRCWRCHRLQPANPPPPHECQPEQTSQQRDHRQTLDEQYRDATGDHGRRRSAVLALERREHGAQRRGGDVRVLPEAPLDVVVAVDRLDVGDGLGVRRRGRWRARRSRPRRTPRRTARRSRARTPRSVRRPRR